MTSNMFYSYKPDYAIHPGEYLEEVLESRNIKKAELADRLNVSEKHISRLIHAHVSLSSELALQLEKTLGVSANIWNNMNAEYELYKARKKEIEKLKEDKEWLKQFPVKELQKMGHLPPGSDPLILKESLLSFFGVPGSQQWEHYYKKTAVHFRKSPAFQDDLAHTCAWLRAGEKRAEEIETRPYNKNKFHKSLVQIRELTNKKPEVFVPEMIQLCADSGLALVFIPEFQKTHISGATRWLSSDKALVTMNLRYKTNDHFWFTFFHEAAHILKHGKKEIFIDTKDEFESHYEQEADKFARNILVPLTPYQKFVKEGAFYKQDIAGFAAQIDIHPAIVVGRLQHDGHILYNWHNGFKEKFTL